MIQYKGLLIDAICGNQVPWGAHSLESLVVFTGNQWNGDWAWDRKGLEDCTVKELEFIYQDVKNPDSYMHGYEEPTPNDEHPSGLCSLFDIFTDNL